VADDAAFQNALSKSGEENARIEHAKVLKRVMTSVMKDDMKLFKEFTDNKSFKHWMENAVYDLASGRAEAR